MVTDEANPEVSPSLLYVGSTLVTKCTVAVLRVSMVTVLHLIGHVHTYRHRYVTPTQ